MLAIDTATDLSSVALYDGQVFTECCWPGSRRQTTSVMPVANSLVGLAGITMSDIAAVAVAIGPGSFTGLRVGLSIAKGMATVDDRAIIGVPTLDLVALPCIELGVPCHAVIPAGRGRVVWAMYDAHGAAEPVNATFAEFMTAVTANPGPQVIGELSPAQRAELQGTGATVMPDVFASRAHALAHLGWKRWQAGHIDDPITLEPIYLHGRPNPR
jgi:tRNA threonylcarbamoyladenosine biosynthesis protein TsaB